VTREIRSDITVDIRKAATGWQALGAGANARLRRAARQAVSMADIAVMTGCGIAVLLADDARVREVNRDWRAKDRPTNVLSFPGAPPERIGQTPHLGDIILAYETVAAEALTEEKPLDHHVMHLVVHGVLHLLGYDHMTPGEAERMESLESAILAALDVPDPYAGSDPLETISE
jgi:probable rRNA maturation factor